MYKQRTQLGHPGYVTPCVRKPTQPAPVFAPKPKEVAKPKETPVAEAVPSTSKEPKTKSKAPAKLRAKPQSKVQKLKSQLQQIVPVAPAPTLEQAQQAIRRTKSVTTHKLVRQAVKLDRTAVQIADHFTAEYSLKAEERRQVIRGVRTARMSQRSLAKRIRRMRWRFTEEGGKRRFIEWLDEYLSDIEGHTSESDEG